MVRPVRFERMTHSVGGYCSIQLSYGRIYLESGKLKLAAFTFW